MKKRNRKNPEEDFRHDPLRQLLYDARHDKISSAVVPLVNKLMAGNLTIDHITLAAQLGHPEAMTICFYLGCGPIGLIDWTIDSERSRAIERMSQLLATTQIDQRKIIVSYACDVADVLPIFEREFPNDSRPRKAITTTRQWVKGLATLQETRAAAAEAESAATYAYDAASAAAYASGAAYAADAIAASKIEFQWQQNRLAEYVLV
jgi:hypothetical protein